MHSRIGLKTEYLGKKWFDLIRDCIDVAAKTNMEAWLYDEDRWPSGPAGGLVTKDKRYQMKILKSQRQATTSNLAGLPSAECWLFAIEFKGEEMVRYRKLASDEEGKKLSTGEEVVSFVVENSPGSSWFNGYTYLDTLSAEAVAAFIQSTHERYRKEFGEHFGKTIPGMFTDEPNHGLIFRNCWGIIRSIPWTGTLREVFKARFGYDLIDRLPEIFYDGLSGVVGVSRPHYHLCKTQMFVNAFSKQVGEWCRKNNLEFTGHVIEEDPISSQVSFVGSAMQFYEYMSAPGIDLLTQYRYEYISVKQCISVARQMGRKWVLSELYGCTGWETTFETYKHIGDWQAVLGITLRCPHLSWYSMEGEAKRDYPASIHFHSPWYREYKIIEDYYARLNLLLTEGSAVCDLAVIHPGESYFKRFRKNIVPDDNSSFSKISDEIIRAEDQKYHQLVDSLLRSHIDFDFIDERMVESLQARCVETAEGIGFQMGRMWYKSILVPDLTTIRKETLALLKQFSEQGGQVLFAGQAPQECDFESSCEPRCFAEGKTVVWDPDIIIAALEERCRRLLIQDRNGVEAAEVFYQLRETPDGLVLFLVNMNRKQNISGLQIRLKNPFGKIQQIQLWDALQVSRSALKAEISEDTVCFSVGLEASGSALLVLNFEHEALPHLLLMQNKTLVQTIPIDGCQFELDDANVFVLDRADARLYGKDGKAGLALKNEEILELDRKIRINLGIEPRGGFSNQPWFEVNEPIGPESAILLSYTFQVDVIPSAPVFLAMEQPENWVITLNGQSVTADSFTAWWVDPAIKKIPIPAGALQAGPNVLKLQGGFDRKIDLELVYLLGSFGVKQTGTSFSISAPPTSLGTGRWADYGLPFYSGNVTYETKVALEKKNAARYVIKLEEHAATAVGIKVNDAAEILLFHGEYETDVSETLISGVNRIEIRLLGSRRNAFGPFHLMVEHPNLISPQSYRPLDEQRQNAIRLADYGIMREPSLFIRVETESLAFRSN